MFTSMLFLKILEEVSIDKPRIGEMKVDYIQNQIYYNDLRIKIPDDEFSIPTKNDNENVFQFEKIFNRQISQELMYNTSSDVLESAVNIFIGTEQTSRFQYFKLYLNRFIQHLNDQIISYDQSQVQDNYQFFPDIQELFNKDYSINILTMNPKATQIDRNKEIQIQENKEIYVQITKKGTDISTYFYYGPTYIPKYKNFYFMFTVPYQRTQDLINNFRQHLLLRKIYTQVQKTNVFMFITEYEDNLSILKTCKGFYNGILKRNNIDKVTDNQLQALIDKVNLLEAEVDKYRRCFEEEHILRLQQEKVYREEIQLLNERLSLVSQSINVPLRQEQNKLFNPTIKRRKVEDM